MPDSFLHLYTRKEAVVKGAYLERPEKHELLLAVEERTSIKNAKAHKLMVYDELVELLGDRFPESSISKSVIELKLDHLLAILPGVFYDEASKSLRAALFIVSRPEKKPYDIEEIYHESLKASVDAVITYSKKESLFDRDSFWKDLESSFSEDGNFEVFYSHIYFNLGLLFEDSDRVISPDKTVFDQFRNDLMKELVLKRKAVWLSNLHIFLIPEDSIEEVGRTLTAFFYNRIFPQYKNIPAILRDYDVISLEEELYNSEKNNIQTMKFTARKAFAVERYLEEDKYRENKFYPGRIVFALIRELEKLINESYEKKNIEYIYSKYDELKRMISGKGEGPYQAIYFFEEPELEPFPREAIEKLKNERSILHTQWERKGSTVQVLMEMTQENFFTILEIFKDLKESDYWKILAFRKMMQDSQKITPEFNPFISIKFLNKYGALLDMAYQEMLPFYLKVFLYIPFGFVKNLAYKVIKKRIEDNQEQYARFNVLKREEQKKGLIKGLTQKKQALKSLNLRNRILEELDFFYFKQNTVPCMMDVKERFPDLKNSEFIDLVKKYNFTIIPMDGGDQWTQDILYYPKSDAWDYSIKKTREHIDNWLKTYAELGNLQGEDIALSKRVQALNLRLQMLS